jgi:tetratricopeptide (TPR) repeat protein
VITTLLAFCLAQPPQTGPSVPEARKDALARFGTGLWQARRERLLSAIRSLEAAAKADPDSTAALKELIPLHTRLGREPEAIRTARIVLERDPRDADTAHALARLLAESGELAEAVTFAKVAAEHIDATTRPEKALAVYRDLATLQDRAGNPAGSIEALKKAIDLLTLQRKAIIAMAAFTPGEVDAEAAETWERIGKALAKAGRADAAAEAFLAAYSLYADPKRVNDKAAAARLEWNLATAHAEKDPATALRHLQAFLTLQPQAVEPYERLVALLNRTERGGEVIALLDAYRLRDPKNLALLAVLAAEKAREPATRAQADLDFTSVVNTTNDPKILRVVLRSDIETNRAARIIDLLDVAYQSLREDGAKATPAREFAANRARAILDLLRTEPDWSAAVMRAAADDLRAGVHRVHYTWYALATIAARIRKLDIAALQYREAIRLAPLNAQGDAYTQLLRVLRMSHRPTEIVSVCRDGLRNSQLFPDFFHYHLALALAELGEADDAIAAADKAIMQSGGGNRLVYRLQKVHVYQRLEKWDDAVTLCRKLLGEFEEPGDRLRIRYTLSACYWGAGKRAEAEAELRSILDEDADHAGACNDLGYHLAEQGRNLDEAERLVRRAVAIDRADRRKSGDPDSDSAAYLDSLAWVLFRREKLAEARDLLQQAAALSDGAHDGVVWDHLGDVFYRLGEKDKARAAWAEAEKQLTLDPRGKREGRLDDVKRKLKRLP